MENVYDPVSNTGIEFLIEILPQGNFQVKMVPWLILSNIWGRNHTTIIEKIQRKETLYNWFYKANIIIILKPDKKYY